MLKFHPSSTTSSYRTKRVSLRIELHTCEYSDTVGEKLPHRKYFKCTENVCRFRFPNFHIDEKIIKRTLLLNVRHAKVFNKNKILIDTSYGIFVLKNPIEKDEDHYPNGS